MHALQQACAPHCGPQVHRGAVLLLCSASWCGVVWCGPPMPAPRVCVRADAGWRRRLEHEAAQKHLYDKGAAGAAGADEMAGISMASKKVRAHAKAPAQAQAHAPAGSAACAEVKLRGHPSYHACSIPRQLRSLVAIARQLFFMVAFFLLPLEIR